MNHSSVHSHESGLSHRDLDPTVHTEAEPRGWTNASVTFFVAVAPDRNYDEVVADLLGEIEHAVQQTRVDYTEIRIKRLSRGEPGGARTT